MHGNALFVTEKWCDGTPNVGWTNNFHNTFTTFQRCNPKWNFNTIHIDEAHVTYGCHVDNILPKYCLKWGVQVIFFCLLGDSNLNPSPATYHQLKELGIKLCFIWPDSGPGWATDTMYGLDMADLHVTWDQARSEFHDKLPPLPNLLKLWCPQDEKMFRGEFYSANPKKQDVVFAGSRYYRERQQMLEFLTAKLPELYVVGGQREDRLTPEAYAEVVRNHKIMLNLPRHPLGFFQLKSRVIESLACMTLVIELKNPSTSQLLTPGLHYVEAETLEDMVEKTKYYLKDENKTQREEIALMGHLKYHNNYHARNYWAKIFEHLKL